MSSTAHQFGQVEFWTSNICCCFLQAGTVEIIKTNIQNSKFKIRHVQINELLKTLHWLEFLKISRQIFLAMWFFFEIWICSKNCKWLTFWMTWTNNTLEDNWIDIQISKDLYYLNPYLHVQIIGRCDWINELLRTDVAKVMFVFYTWIIIWLKSDFINIEMVVTSAIASKRCQSNEVASYKELILW